MFQLVLMFVISNSPLRLVVWQHECHNPADEDDDDVDEDVGYDEGN